MATIVITVIGDDKAGLVDALSGVVADHGGNWDRSHMSELAGKFAGIVLVTAPAGRTEALLRDLKALEQEGLFSVTAEVATADVEPQPESSDSQVLVMKFVGPDHPGIVHEISHSLAKKGLSIEELETEVVPAPMGGHLFRATAKVIGPGGISLDDLHDELETATPEMVIELAEATDATSS